MRINGISQIDCPAICTILIITIKKQTGHLHKVLRNHIFKII